MRQRELSDYEAFSVVEAPELPEGIAERPSPATAVPDMPKAAAILMVGVYAALLLAFVVTIRGARADFAIVIGAFYLAMFFGVPAAFLGTEGDVARRPDLATFLDRGIDTATGHLSGAGALVQMLIVPVLLTFAVLAMGLAYLFGW